LIIYDRFDWVIHVPRQPSETPFLLVVPKTKFRAV
jgi:hypothetical protein